MKTSVDLALWGDRNYPRYSIGAPIGVLGGLIALLRRTLEGQARLGGHRVRLPRGLGELVRGASIQSTRQRPAE